VASETERFLELKQWILSLGCCQLCSIRLAVLVCEWEAGRKYDMQDKCKGIRDSKGVRTTCDAVTITEWWKHPGIATRGR
jgi:hypothetical protein